MLVFKDQFVPLFWSLIGKRIYIKESFPSFEECHPVIWLVTRYLSNYLFLALIKRFCTRPSHLCHLFSGKKKSDWQWHKFLYIFHQLPWYFIRYYNINVPISGAESKIKRKKSKINNKEEQLLQRFKLKIRMFVWWGWSLELGQQGFGCIHSRNTSVLFTLV